jgi:hypothetical protein
MGAEQTKQIPSKQKGQNTSKQKGQNTSKQKGQVPSEPTKQIPPKQKEQIPSIKKSELKYNRIKNELLELNTQYYKGVEIVPLTGNYKEMMLIKTYNKTVWILGCNGDLIVFDKILFKNIADVYADDASNILVGLRNIGYTKLYCEQKANFDAIPDDLKSVVKNFLS